MKKRIWRWLLPLLLVLCIVFTGWVIWDNNRFVVTHYTIENEKIPDSFTGFRIAQVSDLHNCEFGENHEDLLQALKDGKPDMIAITGDLVDSYFPHLERSMDFVARATQVAPVYYVSGNHESRQDYKEICRRLEQLDVTVLDGNSVVLTRETDTITLLGVQDPAFFADSLSDDKDEDKKEMRDLLSQLQMPEGFCVLLSHRNDMLELYAETGADLVLSGHAHGGQFRLPWIGGIYAGKLFPKHDGGVYTQEDTTLVVSRGLGNSLFPFRVNNPPELVFVTLKSE